MEKSKPRKDRELNQTKTKDESFHGSTSVLHLWPEGLRIRDFCFGLGCGNDPSAGSPTETLLRLHLPLDDEV